MFSCSQGLKKVKAQGIGVHKPEEILEFGQNDLKVLSDVLGDKLYFFGNEPSTVNFFIIILIINVLLTLWFIYNNKFIVILAGRCGFCKLGSIVLLRQRC